MTQEIIEKPMSAECTMKQYESIPDSDLVENREYQLTDYPDNGANAEQMAYALTCKRLFPANTVVTFSGATDSNYTNGHLYQIQVDTSGTKSWKDITPTGEQSIPIITGTQEKPINLATDLEVGKYYFLQGYIFRNSTNTITIKEGQSVLTFKDYYSAEYSQVYINAYSSINGLIPDGTCSVCYFFSNADGIITQTKFGYSNISVNDSTGTFSSYLGYPKIYAPTSPGKAGQVLYSIGIAYVPEWRDQTSITSKQQTYFVTEKPTVTGTPYAEHDLVVVNNQTVYALEKVNDVLTWVKKYSVGDNGQIKTVIYDNTTLGDHIADILQYVNVENGGTLLSIGFKTGTASVAATATKTTITNGANPTVATSSEAVLKPATFYSFRSADINKTGNVTMLTLNGPNGLTGCSSTNIEITSDSSTETPTNTCVADGCGQSINADGAVEIITFKGVNLLSIPLEHLVIDYFEV